MIELDESMKKSLQGYKYIDLFCGIGGFHLALSSFGAKCIFASDINTSAKKIYNQYFSFMPDGDITKIDARTIPEHEILCGGFPCQAFSISGKGKGFSDEKSGKLFFEINRILKVRHPKIIILENVANLEKHWNGYSLKHILHALEIRGYDVFIDKLNAFNFGIPQFRKRLYIVAFDKSLGITHFLFPKPLPFKCSLESIIQKETDESVYITQKYVLRENICNIELICKKPCIRIGEIGQGRQGERIYSIKGCSTTLSSSSGGPGGRTGMYLINNRVRKLTPRECARLMGFPDDFVLDEKSNQAYKQLGNSVVVDVLQYIIKNIIQVIQKEKNDGKKINSVYNEL